MDLLSERIVQFLYEHPMAWAPFLYVLWIWVLKPIFRNRGEANQQIAKPVTNEYCKHCQKRALADICATCGRYRLFPKTYIVAFFGIVFSGAGVLLIRNGPGIILILCGIYLLGLLGYQHYRAFNARKPKARLTDITSSRD